MSGNLPKKNNLNNIELNGNIFIFNSSDIDLLIYFLPISKNIDFFLQGKKLIPNQYDFKALKYKGKNKYKFTLKYKNNTYVFDIHDEKKNFIYNINVFINDKLELSEKINYKNNNNLSINFAVSFFKKTILIFLGILIYLFYSKIINDFIIIIYILIFYMILSPFYILYKEHILVKKELDFILKKIL